MSRKSSVIMTAEERKNAKKDVQDSLAKAKETLKSRKQEFKEAKKAVDEAEKAVTGLQTRLNALKPAPKPVVIPITR